MIIFILIVVLIFTFSWGAHHKSEHNKFFEAYFLVNEEFQKTKRKLKKTEDVLERELFEKYKDEIKTL